MSKIRTKRHENPFELAQQIRDTPPGLRGAVFSLRRATTYTYERMSSATVLLPGMGQRLTEARAPTHIGRWVVWAKLMPNRVLRLGLALYVRREQERIGQGESGLCWLKDAQQNIAEAIFLESPKGQLTLDWVKASVFKDEYQASDGSVVDRFWNELDQKLHSVPLDKFWAEIDRRVAAKPKRNPPKKSRIRTAPRQGSLPKEVRDALKAARDAVQVLTAYESEQYGTKKR